MRAFLSLLALITLPACEQLGIAVPGGGPPTLPEQLISSDAPQYSRGSPVRIRLYNSTTRTLGYNLCRSRLERRGSDGDWQTVMESLGEVCTAELRTLRPGHTAGFEFTPEGRLRRGEYRVATEVQDFPSGARVLAVSNGFGIGSDGD